MAKFREIKKRQIYNYYYVKIKGSKAIYCLKGKPAINKHYYLWNDSEIHWITYSYCKISTPSKWVKYPLKEIKVNFPNFIPFNPLILRKYY